MSTSQIVFWGVAAVLLFWVVGAYNRLVRLRGDLVQRFAPVDEQFRQRHALLLEQIDALAPVLANAAPRLDALRAACQQAQSACDHAKQRPGAVGAITSLRLAEQILAEARARLPVPTTAGTTLPALSVQLAAVDTTLAFARKQFNEAVEVYNHAIRQFPTRVLAAVFGFRAGGTL
jgi:LemA protein